MVHYLFNKTTKEPVASATNLIELQPFVDELEKFNMEWSIKSCKN